MTSVSSEIRKRCRDKIAEQLRKNAENEDIKDKKKEEKKEELFTHDVKLKPEQKMFSELFFDPKEIDRVDLPVDTFHHLKESWPEWIQALIPKEDEAYQWNKHVVYSFVAADDEHRMLVGDPGSGKTSLPMQVAAITGRPVFKQAFQNDLEADEWIMSKEIDSDGTRWNILPFVKTLEYPVYAVLDEFNRLRRGGRLLMNQLLNEGGSLQLRDGREVHPHKQWKAIATDNTKGMGDGLDKFDGDIADISTTDRFGIMIEVDYLPTSQQVVLLQQWFPELSDDIARQIVEFGNKITLGYKLGSFSLPWTPRRMKNAAKMALRYRNTTNGIQDAYYNFLAEDSEKATASQCLKDLGIDKLFGTFK